MACGAGIWVCQAGQQMVLRWGTLQAVLKAVALLILIGLTAVLSVYIIVCWHVAVGILCVREKGKDRKLEVVEVVRYKGKSQIL